MSRDEHPSRWSRRLLLVGLAALGFAIASTLALYQWGVLATVWEPFFGSGSRNILHSEFARRLPIPDAALGAIAYLVDGVAGLLGGPERYRTQPAFVVVMALAVIPMGLASLGLIALQAFVFREFCTLCLASAAISLCLVPLAWPEIHATWRCWRRRRVDKREI